MFGKIRCTKNPRQAFLRLEPLETRAVPALLHTNGLWVTGTGNGFGGADTSAVQGGYVTFGFTASAATFRVADDFVVPTTVAGWNLSQVRVFAYQTLSDPDQNTFTKLHYKIYNDDPSGGGAVILDCSGPKAVDVTTSSVFTNTYRVDSDDLQNDDRPVRRITGNMCEPRRLVPGDYWLEWGVDGNPQFSPPRANVTVPWDIADNGKKLDVATGIWTPMTDPISQGGSGNTHDIPFEIHGRETPLPIPPAPDRHPLTYVAIHSAVEAGARMVEPPQDQPAPNASMAILTGQRFIAHQSHVVESFFSAIDWAIDAYPGS